uniref:Uncharacterized protein n=1 Tax=Romanomermis culicivorax TaxID=13658 RepID=A0A915JSC7_ROMCU
MAVAKFGVIAGINDDGKYTFYLRTRPQIPWVAEKGCGEPDILEEERVENSPVRTTFLPSVMLKFENVQMAAGEMFIFDRKQDRTTE